MPITDQAQVAERLTEQAVIIVAKPGVRPRGTVKHRTAISKTEYEAAQAEALAQAHATPDHLRGAEVLEDLVSDIGFRILPLSKSLFNQII